MPRHTQTSFFAHLEMLLLEQMVFAAHQPQHIALHGFCHQATVDWLMERYCPQSIYWVDGAHLKHVSSRVIVTPHVPEGSVDCYLVAQAHMCQWHNQEWLATMHRSLVTGGMMLCHGLGVGSFGASADASAVPCIDMTVLGDALHQQGWSEAGVSMHDIEWEVASAALAVRELADGGIRLCQKYSNQDRCAAMTWPQNWPIKVLLAHARRADSRHVAAVPISAIRRRYNSLEQGHL